MENRNINRIEEIMERVDCLFLLKEEFLSKINNSDNRELKYIINDINIELEKFSEFKIIKLSNIVGICNKSLKEEEVFEELFQYQYEKFLNNKLMILYFQIKDYRYISDEKLEDYTSGYMFGKLWNLEFLESFNSNINIKGKSKFVTKPLKLKGKKRNGLTRNFGYPNFINFIQLRKILLENKREVTSILEKNKNSYSKFFMNSYTDNKKLEMMNMEMKNKENILKLDVQNFYGSIYTHAIDWSIRGKEEAKKYKKNGSFGAQLDQYVQDMNNGETFGLLIGTDISRIIAELFISSIENLELKEVKGIEFYRFVDDYTIFYNNVESKDNFLKSMEFLLEKYRLQLNGNKIKNISKFEYMGLHCRGNNIYNNNLPIIRDYLEEGYINGIASIIYESIYKYVKNEDNISMYILYKEIEKIFNYISVCDNEKQTSYLDRLKCTNFVDVFMEIFIQKKGLDKYFLEFLYNNYDKVDNKWEGVLNQEIENNYKKNNIYVIQILSLMFVYKLGINEKIIKLIIEHGDSISTTIVYSYIKVNNIQEKYQNNINKRIQKSIKGGGFESEDFIFLTEYYLRNRKHISKNKKNVEKDIINFNVIKDTKVNKIYKKFIKETKEQYLIDYKKMK